jgi:hypothetical protein
MFERICLHGVGHPDPDQCYFWSIKFDRETAFYKEIHGCDGCCIMFPEVKYAETATEPKSEEHTGGAKGSV